MEPIEHAIATIYDAALEPAGWPGLLATLAKLFNSSFADSFQRTIDYRSFQGVAFGLDDSDYQDVFLGHWVKQNVWGRRRPVRRAGDVLTTREMMPIEDLRRSQMFGEYLEQRGLHEGMRLDIWAGEGWIEDISLLRPWSHGPYTAGERRLAHTLMPHLRRATAVARRLREAEQLALAGLSALDEMHTAVLLLNDAGRPLYRNAAAATLLAADDGLAETPLGLVAATNTLTGQLAAILAIASRRATMPPRSGAMVLPRPSGGRALSLVTIPLGRAAEFPGMDLPGGPTVLLCIIDPAARSNLRRNELTLLFGLTQAEAAVALDLLAGLDAREIAEQRGRSINTVRTQLARLMAKTDTSRQAELVSLLVRLQFG